MNLIVWFLIGLFILIIMAVVSNSGASAIDRIELQIFLMNCPAPIYHGEVSNLNTNGLAVNYTVNYGPTEQDFQNTFNGTYFNCYDGNEGIEGLDPAPTVTAIKKAYGDTLFGFIPVGWLGYISDYLVHVFQSAQAFIVMMGYFMTPANFSVLGFDLNDLTGITLFIVIALYVFAYVPIVLFAYKAISPFVGG